MRQTNVRHGSPENGTIENFMDHYEEQVQVLVQMVPVPGRGDCQRPLKHHKEHTKRK